MNNCILAHNDLDGLYSAMLFYNSHDVPIHEVCFIDYGQDHSNLKDQFDNFFVFDFGENPGGDKTTLWVDHHLRQEGIAEFQVFGKAPSCVRLMLNKDLINKDLLLDEDYSCIDQVDSAAYDWSNLKPEDIVFPKLDTKIGKYIALNQLLRKNRKNGMTEKLFSNPIDVDVLLYKIEKDRGPKTVKWLTYVDSKEKLRDKLVKEPDKFIKYFSKVPILFTKEFTQKDWVGYDSNLFGLLAATSPYLIVVFDFSDGINVQVIRNPHYRNDIETVYNAIKDDLGDNPRGHDGIINLSFKNHKEAIIKLDSIVEKLAVYLS